MTTSNSSFLLGIKVLGLTAIVAILFSSSSANVAVTIQTSYAQSSTTSAGPTMTPPLAQNTTTSNPVDEGVIINSLVFEAQSLDSVVFFSSHFRRLLEARILIVTTYRCYRDKLDCSTFHVSYPIA